MTTDNKAQAVLSRWLSKMPSNATRLHVKVNSFGGSQTVLDLKREEIDLQTNNGLTDLITSACESWADSSGREKFFIGEWIGETERVIATLQWRTSPSNTQGVPHWDGTIESLVGALHNQIFQQNKLYLELVRTVIEGAQGTLQQVTERNIYLEQQRIDSEKVREQLVRAEAALLAENPDTAQSGRFMEIFEKFMLAAMNRQQPPQG